MTVGFRVEAVNVSEQKGGVKTPVERIVLREGHGIEGDAHAGPWHRQISLLSSEQIAAFDGAGRPMKPGEFAENITTSGIDLRQIAVLDRITIGDVLIEITQIGKECHSGCAIFQEVGACIMPKEGLFGRVLRGGEIRAGMAGTCEFRPLRIEVITLSDRASQGIYEDRSGARIEAIIREYFAGRRGHPDIVRHLIPDDADRLMELLEAGHRRGADFILTTGSTGIGPRDIAPEVTQRFCDRIIPGIMEFMRATFGSKKRTVYLTRGYAGLKGSTVVFNMPGSVRAVEEMLPEWLTFWGHMICMIHSIDAH